MTEGRLRAELLLDRQLPEDLGDDLTAELAGLGVTVARTARTKVHLGPADFDWLVLVSLPLQAFLAGLGTEAVADSWQALRRVVKRVASGRRREPVAAGDPPAVRPLVLHDEVSGVRIVLEPDLPDTAYQQLLELDLTRFRLGPLHYDRMRGCWRSELDEAAGRRS